MTSPLTLSGLNKLRCHPAAAPQSFPTTNAFSFYKMSKIKTKIYIHIQTHKYIPAACISYGLYLLFTKMVKKAYEVTNKMYYSVGVGAERGVRVTTASQVRCNDMIAMVGQKGNLVAP
jgi:hypothetical protein